MQLWRLSYLNNLKWFEDKLVFKGESKESWWCKAQVTRSENKNHRSQSKVDVPAQEHRKERNKKRKQEERREGGKKKERKKGGREERRKDEKMKGKRKCWSK